MEKISHQKNPKQMYVQKTSPAASVQKQNSKLLVNLKDEEEIEPAEQLATQREKLFENQQRLRPFLQNCSGGNVHHRDFRFI